MAHSRDRNQALKGADSDQLAELLGEREALLAGSPRLRAFQQELDQLMAYCCDPNLRFEILCMLLEDKLDELLKAVAEVQLASRKRE